MDKIKSLFQSPSIALGIGSVTIATTLFYLSVNRSKSKAQHQQSIQSEKLIDPTVKHVSLCQRFGEEDALKFIISNFFKTFSSDKQLKHFFTEKNKNQIEIQLITFIQTAFGSTKFPYNGQDLKSIHHNLHINDEQFDLVISQFEQVSSQFGIGKNEIEDAKVLLQSLRPQIVNVQIEKQQNGMAQNQIVQEKEEVLVEQIKIDPSVKVVPLSETLGGDDIVKMIAEEFFSKLTSDKTFSSHFQSVNKKELKAKVVKHIQLLFGSPNIKHSGKSLSEAHSHMKITNQQFNNVVIHLQKSFETFAIDQKETVEGITLLESVRKQFVG